MLVHLLRSALAYNEAAWGLSQYEDHKGRYVWSDDQAALGYVTAYKWLKRLGVDPA
jgi:hypothetical protein